MEESKLVQVDRKISQLYQRLKHLRCSQIMKIEDNVIFLAYLIDQIDEDISQAIKNKIFQSPLEKKDSISTKSSEQKFQNQSEISMKEDQQMLINDYNIVMSGIQRVSKLSSQVTNDGRKLIQVPWEEFRQLESEIRSLHNPKSYISQAKKREKERKKQLLQCKKQLADYKIKVQKLEAKNESLRKELSKQGKKY